MNSGIDSKILNQLPNLISLKGEFNHNVVDALSVFASGFLEHIVSVIQTQQKESSNNFPIRPCDVTDALKKLNFKGVFINKHKKIFNEYLNDQKNLKLQRLRDAGYGATNEHVQFIQRILECPHQTYVHDEMSNEQIEYSESYLSD